MDTGPLPLQSFSLVNHRYHLHDKLLKSGSLLSNFNNLSLVGFSLNISDARPIPRQSTGGVAASLSTQYLKGVAHPKLKVYPFTSRVCVCAVCVYKKSTFAAKVKSNSRLTWLGPKVEKPSGYCHHWESLRHWYVINWQTEWRPSVKNMYCVSWNVDCSLQIVVLDSMRDALFKPGNQKILWSA